ncbi:O-antigen ligase family protein [uncultured Algibacter sp.]|uniref:O-antigen ligase family protein n=1 Tax=uncultured Algibacter sp. TaxID=298659 RepID=UPI002639297A|nr:O-antigen ligase family protein [uncultured Algibacter sp.]
MLLFYLILPILFLEMLKYLSSKTSVEKIYILLLSFVFFSLPFSFALNSVSLGIYIFFGFFYSRNKTLKNIKDVFLCFALSAFFVISLFWLRNFENAQFEFLLRISPIIFLPFLFFMNQEKYNMLELTWVLTISSILALLYGVFSAVEFYTRPEEHFELIHLPHTLRGNYHAVYFSIQLGINIILLFFSFKKTRNVYLLILAFLLFFAMILLGKRMPLLSVILLGIVYTCNSLKKFVIYLLSLIFFATVFIFTPYNKWRFNKLSEVGEGSERIIMLKASGQLISERVLLGFGTGNVSKNLERTYEGMNIKTPFYSNNPHNLFLFILISHGLLGLVIFIMFQLKVLKFAWGKNNKLFLYTYLFLLFVSMTEVILIRQQGIILYSLILSYLFFNKKSNIEATNYIH